VNWAEAVHTKSKPLYHRYLAVGVEVKGKFSGRVYDYGGGGTYCDEYVLDGVTGMEAEDSAAQLAELRATYPGLVEQVDAEFRKVARLVEGGDYQLAATRTFVARYLKGTSSEDQVYQSGRRLRNLPEIGNTSFEQED
jgi:hypothetical protein